jgi:acetylserotonin N-methyltransferase
MDATPAPPPDPTVVLDTLEAFRRSKAMFAAVELGVFDALTAGHRTAAELANELRCNEDALRRLLDACVGLGLLVREGERHGNTPAAACYLTSTSPRRLTGYLRYSNEYLWKLWGSLEDAVREGTNRWKQVYGWDGPIFSNFFRTEDAKREFLMGMHGFGLISSPRVVEAFDLDRFRRLVDLGGATGHLAVAACERYPRLDAVVFDLPEALPLARQLMNVTPVASRIELVAGDFFVDPIPEGDIYALGRIVHDWSEEKILKLFGRIHERLPSGGALLIAEKVLLDDRSGPSWAHFQNLNMLTCTEGKERTFGEYEALLRRAGFVDAHCRRTSAPLDAVLARKP